MDFDETFEAVLKEEMENMRRGFEKKFESMNKQLLDMKKDHYKELKAKDDELQEAIYMKLALQRKLERYKDELPNS